MTDPSLIDHGRQVPSESPPVSAVDLRGVAPALAPQVTLRTDDHGVRMLALAPWAGARAYRNRDPCTPRGRHGRCTPFARPAYRRRATSPARRSSSPVRTATYASGCLSHEPHHWTRHRIRTRRPVCAACIRGRALHPMAGGGEARAAQDVTSCAAQMSHSCGARFCSFSSAVRRRRSRLWCSAPYRPGAWPTRLFPRIPAAAS